jgi:hypothetical protein
MQEPYAARINAVKELMKMFKPERMVHLTVTTMSLAALMTCTVTAILKGKAEAPFLVLMFGSSGVITYTASRLLQMWNQALQITFDPTLQLPSKTRKTTQA